MLQQDETVRYRVLMVAKNKGLIRTDAIDTFMLCREFIITFGPTIPPCRVFNSEIYLIGRQLSDEGSLDEE
jgi:hypothetical protein